MSHVMDRRHEAPLGAVAIQVHAPMLGADPLDRHDYASR